MFHLSGNNARVVKQMLAALTVVTALHVVGARVLLGIAVRAATQGIYRDTALLPANEFLSGRKLEDIFQELRRLLPNPVVAVVHQQSGEIETLLGECSYSKDFRYQPTLLGADIESPCHEPRLLLSKIALPDLAHPRLFLMFAAPAPWIGLFSTKDNLRIAGVVALIPFISLLLFLLFVQRLFERFFLQQESILSSVREYTAGNLQTRVKPGFFRELNELSETFNQMAGDYQAAQAQIEEDDKRRKQLFATLLHDLRTPIAGISAAAENLLSCSFDTTREQEYRSIFDAGLEQLKDLNRNLVQLGTNDSALLEFSPKRLSLSEFVESTLFRFRSLEHQVAAIASSLSVDGTFVGDRELLQRAVLNLLQNALHYGGPNATIRLSATAQERNIVFSVQDDGPGISAEAMPSLFEEFYRSSNSQSVKRGFGLGLSFVRRVAKAHGGNATCESILGQGSVFKLCISRDVSFTRSTAHFNETEPTPLENRATSVHYRTLEVLSRAAVLLAFIVSGLNAPSLSLACGLVAGYSLIAFLGRRILVRQDSCFAMQQFLASIVLVVMNIFYPHPQSAIAQGVVFGLVVVPLLLGALSRKYLFPYGMLYSVVLFFGARHGQLGLGSIVGIMLGFGPTLLDRFQGNRRMTLRLMMSGFVFLSCTLVLECLVFDRTVPKLFAGESSDNADSLSCPSDVQQCLSRFYLINPLRDYFLFRPGEHLPITGQFSEQKPNFDIARMEKHIPFPSGDHLLIRHPGDWALRRIRQHTSLSMFLFAAYAILSSLILLIPLGLFFDSRWHRIFAKLHRGVERYRKAQYHERIDLPANSPMYEVAREFDLLASRLPEIRSVVEKRRNEGQNFVAKFSATMTRVEHDFAQSVQSIQYSRNENEVEKLFLQSEYYQDVLHLLLTSYRQEHLTVASEKMNLAELVGEFDGWSGPNHRLGQHRCLLMRGQQSSFIDVVPEIASHAIRCILLWSWCEAKSSLVTLEILPSERPELRFHLENDSALLEHLQSVIRAVGYELSRCESKSIKLTF